MFLYRIHAKLFFFFVSVVLQNHVCVMSSRPTLSFLVFLSPHRNIQAKCVLKATIIFF